MSALQIRGQNPPSCVID